MSTETHAAVRERERKWLGDASDRWSAGRLFQVADVWTSNVDKHAVDGEMPVRLCNYTDVYKNDAIVDGMDFMTATATREQIARFRLKAGDSLVTKDSETADDIGIPAFVEVQADDLICGYHLAIMRPRPGRVVPRFLFWALKSDPTKRQWSVLASGVTRVGIRSSDLRKVAIPLPPLAEQRRIADLLDRETAQIDALIAKQEQFIGHLNERRVGVVVDASWGGLDRDARVSPSGVENTPSSPDHWRRLRNKNVFREVVDLSADGVGELLTVSHITGITPRSMKNVNMFEAVTLEGYKHVAPGDLAINTMWAWMGALGTSRYEGLVSPAYGVYRPLPDVPYEPRYFDYLYRTPAYVVEMTRNSRGITSSRLRLYPESFLRLPVVVPPLAEQREIVVDLDKRTSRIDALIAKAQELITLAKERRAALITEAVTGRIDVSLGRGA